MKTPLLFLVGFYLITSLILSVLHFDFKNVLCRWQSLTRANYDYDQMLFEGLKPEHVDNYESIVKTRDQDDLIVEKVDEESLERVKNMGVAILKNVISKDTVDALRAHALSESDHDWANGVGTQVIILDPPHRWHGMPELSEPSVRSLLRELGEHDLARELIDNIISPLASLTSFSVIRAGYGSVAQEWHSDSGLVSTGGGYTQDFAFDGYTLVIPLQDVEEGMGETSVCPGVWTPNGDSINVDTVFYNEAAGKERPVWVEGTADEMCMKVQQEAGDILFFKEDIIHRGGAHTQPNKPDRFSLFILLTESRRGTADHRWLIGSSKIIATYCQKIGLWGLHMQNFWVLDLGLGKWLWRVPYFLELAKVYARHILAVTVWPTKERLPIDFIDDWCLLFKERNIDGFGSDNDGNGFYLENYVQIMKGAEFWIPILRGVAVGVFVGVFVLNWVLGKVWRKYWGVGRVRGTGIENGNGKHHAD
ncbi:hypothetical protein TrLO_g8884 [Triparma laevis f. longispina]|uniref:Uncharacterized protein n=1 Tax=Triparma laevis f. longispina TaxID=1714387 RepID=A0A9W7C6D6_9STRA|nr:hypothetical protein TrLO_g8884 [Triparma laevis f. longispina]